MRLEIFAILLLVGIDVSLGVSWVAKDYPNPQTEPDRCKTGGDGSWFCDPDSVLTSEEATTILTTIKDVNLGAECVCNCTVNPDNGYVVGVALVGAIAWQSNSDDPSVNLEEFGQTVKDSWFGSSACDDRVLILLSRNDSQIRRILGSRLTEIVPTESLDSIDTETEPLLQKSQYNDALDLTLRELALAIRVNLDAVTTETPTTEAPEPEDNLVWGILGVIAIMSILIFHYWIKY